MIVFFPTCYLNSLLQDDPEDVPTPSTSGTTLEDVKTHILKCDEVIITKL